MALKKASTPQYALFHTKDDPTHHGDSPSDDGSHGLASGCRPSTPILPQSPRGRATAFASADPNTHGQPDFALSPPPPFPPGCIFSRGPLGVSVAGGVQIGGRAGPTRGRTRPCDGQPWRRRAPSPGRCWRVWQVWERGVLLEDAEPLCAAIVRRSGEQLLLAWPSSFSCTRVMVRGAAQGIGWLQPPGSGGHQAVTTDRQSRSRTAKAAVSLLFLASDAPCPCPGRPTDGLALLRQANLTDQ